MSADLRRLALSLRIGDVYPITRRLAGLQYLSPEDFLPRIEPAEAERLKGLAARARGEGPEPLFIYGVMPRSGTNFLRDLIALHPDVCCEPGRLYEFPLLHAARAAAGFMEEFISLFPPNDEVIGRWDGLAMLAGAWMRELQIEAGARHVLMKSPHVQNLNLAPVIFPGSRSLLVLRDGRDVIDSSMTTFSKVSPTRKTFNQLAWEWRLAAETILDCGEGGPHYDPSMMVVRYEELAEGPDKTRLDAILGHLNLDKGRYDHAAATSMPVRGSSRSRNRGEDRWRPEERNADFRSVGRWAAWSASRKARFDRIAGDVLERVGYDRSC